MQTPPQNSKAPYFYICLVLLLGYVLLAMTPEVRVGDGSEYYGLLYAWDLTHRPWMTPAAFEAYDALFKTNRILGLVTTDFLANAFPALRIGATADFNHFWFYSFLAFVCAKIVSLTGLDLSPHRSFLALHFVLLSVTFGIAYRHFRLRGVVAVAMMLFASPMFWFLDKVHTELMTVCLTLSAVMLVTARRYLAAAVFIALASTQNPSFALVACIPLFYRVVLQREQAYRFIDVAMAVTVVLAVLAHPVYYFARYGVVTPQLLAGGAELGRNIWTFYIWILDPDLGLLPNWPLGLLVLGLAIVFAVRSRRAGTLAFDKLWLGFLLGYLAINFFAHSSTTNLNSGATPGLARYALWYLPLGFPVFMYVLSQFPVRTRRFKAALVVVAVLTLVSMAINDPRRYERFSTPSILSRLIQTHAPWLYNPPTEVFIERYAGIGEYVNEVRPLAVVGPDCSKTIVMPEPGRRGAIAPRNCMFEPNKLNAWTATPEFLALAGTQTHYVNLAPAQTDRLLIKVLPGQHATTSAGDGNVFLGVGWSTAEDWGVWSDGNRAALMIPCNAKQYFGAGKPFTVTIKLRPFNSQKITVMAHGGTLWQGAITSVDQVVEFTVPPEACKDGAYDLWLDIPNAVSPAELKMSPDPRKLGVGMSSIEIKPGTAPRQP